ncbi:hypothetical protein [Paraglaciecola sp. 2405UD69-4]|uniref:hypothetical protein n=1 Tax=Paraglaciecola sp. 2405UD69-4 TaxID=3391836 RepID=UPI0039C92FE9
MKNLFIKEILKTIGVIAILATPAAQAKLNSAVENESQTTSLEAEIKQNIANMIGLTEAPVSKSQIAKEINAAALELQTDELVRSNNEQLPKFKFKVVIAE